MPGSPTTPSSITGPFRKRRATLSNGRGDCAIQPDPKPPADGRPETELVSAQPWALAWLRSLSWLPVIRHASDQPLPQKASGQPRRTPPPPVSSGRWRCWSICGATTHHLFIADIAPRRKGRSIRTGHPDGCRSRSANPPSADAWNWCVALVGQAQPPTSGRPAKPPQPLVLSTRPSARIISWVPVQPRGLYGGST